MKIGNIVSNSKIDVSDDFNVVQSLDEIIQGLPTLIVGWELVNDNFTDFDVVTKKISDNLYWTFKKTENRSQHEIDIYHFIENTYKALIADVSYVFVDPIHFSKRKIKKIITKIKSIDKLVTYNHNGMLYIYGEKIIFGVDLSLLDFIGINTIRTIDKIMTISSIFLTYDSIFIEYKQKVENIDNQVKFIPYLYSIKNG